MPGNNQATGLSDGGVFSLGKQEAPKNQRMGRWSQGHRDGAVTLHSPYKGQSLV